MDKLTDQFNNPLNKDNLNKDTLNKDSLNNPLKDNTGKDLVSNMQSSKDLLIDDIRAAIADGEALLRETANSSGEKLAEVRMKAEQSINLAKQRLTEVQDDILYKAKSVSKATDVYVHDNPWRSIGLAATVGVIAGLLISRRNY